MAYPAVDQRRRITSVGVAPGPLGSDGRLCGDRGVVTLCRTGLQVIGEPPAIGEGDVPLSDGVSPQRLHTLHSSRKINGS